MVRKKIQIYFIWKINSGEENANVSNDTITVLLRVAFLVGAITDGLAVMPMLSRRIGTALFGGDRSRDNIEYRFAMGIGAALMAGWTLLLLWGAASPIARRDILLLTVFPVITGIVLAMVFTARLALFRCRVRSRSGSVFGVVSMFYIVVYVLSMPVAQTEHKKRGIRYGI